MDNPHIMERLGRQRFEESLEAAEHDRLTRLAEEAAAGAPVWKRLLKWMAGPGPAVPATDAAESASQAGGRLASNATGAGEVPGL